MGRVDSGGKSEYWTNTIVGELIMVYLIRDEVWERYYECSDIQNRSASQYY